MEISYSGQTWKYFANEQGIALPGYFPYYPVAGHLSIWDQNSNSLKVNTRFNETSFSVRVNTALKVFSNLPEQADRNNFLEPLQPSVYMQAYYPKKITMVPYVSAARSMDRRYLLRWKNLRRLGKILPEM